MARQSSLYEREAALHIGRMEIGARIATRRRAVGLSQPALGKLVGVSGSAVSQWERGLDHPRPERHQALADALHVDVIWLLTGRDGVPMTEGAPKDSAPSKNPELDLTIDLYEILASIQIDKDTKRRLITEVISFVRRAVRQSRDESN